MYKDILLSAASLVAAAAVLIFVTSALQAKAAPDSQSTRNVIPFTDSLYTIGTTSKSYLVGYFDELCLTGDTCETAWPVGGGGGASSTIIKLNGIVSNTGVPTLDFGTSSGLIVTESPTDEFNISLFTTSPELAALLSDETGTGLVVLNTAPTLFGTTTASTTSNAAASITNPLIIIDPGTSNSWSTTNPFGSIAWQLPGETNSNIRTRIAPVMEGTNGNASRLGLFTSTGSGAPSERLTIGSTGLVGIGSTTPGYTLAVNGTSYFVGTTTIADSLTFNGVNGSTWASFCTSITGGAGLCDGVDDTAAAGSGLATTSTWTVGQLARVVSNTTVNSIATSALAIALSDTTGTLAETRGGTNQTTYATGDILYASSANTLAKRAIGSTGNVLMVQSGIPTWVATSSLGISGGSGMVYLATTTTWTVGNLARVASNGAVDSVATSSLGLSPSFTTSAALAALLSDETGTGAAVFAGAPTLTGTTTVGGLSIGSLTGVLKAAAGSVVTGLVNLASEVTGILPVANGGTGASTLNDLITLATHTTGNFIATITGTANEITVTGSGSENAGVTLSLPATIDLGGKTSFEIPNGTNPTVDATGECAWDTTDDQLVCGDSGNNARVVAHDEFKLKDVTIASTSAVFFNGGVLPIGSHKDGLEITQYRCFVTGGTSVVLNLSDGTNDTETITCATTVTSDTDVATNDTFTADEIMNLEFGAITGSVNYVHFEAYARITRE